MDWQQMKDLPIGHVWSHHDLGQHFDIVAGGVAFPGRRPGFGLIAGLRSVHIAGQTEIYVLDEVESADLGELLRLCNGLIPKYHYASSPHDRFTWCGDWRNAAAQRLVCEAGQPSNRSTAYDLSICSTPVLDMETPYAYMVAKIRQATREGHKTLFLRGSRAGAYLTDIPPNEIAFLTLGEYPAVEALAFVIGELRAQAERLIWERQEGWRHKPKRHYDPLGRDEYGHRQRR